MSGDDLIGLLDRFQGIRVLIIGESILDGYLRGAASRLCPEAPAPVVLLAQRSYAPGGAANTAANLQALGAHATLLSVTGDDAHGQHLRTIIECKGIDISCLITQPGRLTVAKERVCAGSQLIVRIDSEDFSEIAQQTETEVLRRLYEFAPQCDAIVISDYGKGVVTDRVIEALAGLQRRQPGLLLVDGKDLTRYVAACPTVVKPNYVQAADLIGLKEPSGNRAQAILDRSEHLLEATGARIAAVTIDSDGSVILERGCHPHRTYAPRTANPQTAGAGDTFLSVFGLALAAGGSTVHAAELASAASAMVVAKEGTATVSAVELISHFAGQMKHAPAGSVLEMSLAYERQRGRRIVFTNGCFDLLHAGHTSYLSRAKSLGDVLVVGVNSDSSVRRLKGDQRPINPLEDRIHVLAALSCIDYIVAFDEDSPVDLIRRIRPDVFVKGGDYIREALPEADVVEAYGGNVEILPYLEDRSTTGMIEEIKRLDLASGISVR